MTFTKEQEKTFERNIIKARIKHLDNLAEPYYRAFNGKIFSLKIEIDMCNQDGDCERVILNNHLPYADTPGLSETIGPEIKIYLQAVFERYKLNQLALKSELDAMKQL